MRFENMSSANINIAVKLVNKCFISKVDRNTAIFWYKEFATPDFKKRWPHLHYLTYQIVYDRNRAIGLTGIYSHKFKKERAWLGWFGVIPEERRKGFGSSALRKTVDAARNRGYREFKIWTDAGDKSAINFYKRNGFRKSRREKNVVYNEKLIFRYPKNAVFYSKILG